MKATRACAVSTCSARIAVSRVMCGRHWSRVPRALRARVWGSRGHAGTPTADHERLVALAVRTVQAKAAAAAAEVQTSRRADRRAGPAGRRREPGRAASSAPNAARSPPLRR